MLNAPPISLKYEREPSYRLFRVTEDGLMFRQVYLTEEGSSLSYQLDLHERSAEDMNQSVDTMSIADLQTLCNGPPCTLLLPKVEDEECIAHVVRAATSSGWQRAHA